MRSRPPSPHLARLADMLWYERRLLEFLLFKLVSAELVVAAAHRFADPAVAELARVVTEARRAEIDRQALIWKIAADWDVDPQVLTLDYIAHRVPRELHMEFVDHDRGFAALGFADIGAVGAILDDLAAALPADQSAGSNSGRAELQGSMEDMLATLTALAAKARAAIATSPGGEDGDSGAARPGSGAAVDSAEAALAMKLQEVGYSAALGAFTRSGQTSLRDFLR